MIERAPHTAACLFALSFLSGLTACASPSFEAERPQIVGGWVIQGGECESDAGVVYRSNGTFAAYDVSGAWKITGDQLITQIVTRGEPGEPVTKVHPPERAASTIIVASPEYHVLRREDGQVHKFRRC
ncbi:MAG: hypothetical protein Q7U11_17685 [Phenylobacterium sp.]|uniref:hypothetical protein n=1 Tax=Phenylobacterium sp. TaxID=1871053 RepID=UPI002717B1FB|nr:hypothetical protein [Phenylobacterium sp.]MDO9248296.1 hypothetical protein [Phenylobacterium sp.]MDP3870568.1 hypothetical protein [Phenylobacterium sp.]